MSKKYGQPAPRSIYPAITSSEQIRELAKNKDHLLVYYALYHGVDDQGRMEARVSTIQTICLGHLPEDAIKPRAVQEALARMTQLVDKDGVPLVYIYEANGTKVLQFARWWTYQGYMRNAWPSRWDPMPGWVDEFRGHGKVAFERMLKDSRGTDGGTDGDTGSGTDGDALYPHPHTSSSSKSASAGPKPWDLFAAYLEGRGIEAKDFPGPRIQLRHAKQMINEGFTVEEVQRATAAFCEDDFWSSKGFDLATIRAHWGKMKNKGKGAKRTPRPLRTVDDIEEPAPLSA